MKDWSFRGKWMAGKWMGGKWMAGGLASGSLMAGLLLAGCLLALAPATRLAAQAPAAGASQAPADGDEASDDPAKPAPRAKPRGRLPAYYSRVVTATQRDRIYEIQAEFNEQIQELQERIAALEMQRDQDVEEVLSPEQLKQVASYREAARSRRGSSKPAPAETQPAGGADSSDS